MTAAAVGATATVGGRANRGDQSGWYARLKKPRFQPPRQVFPIVWPMLYLDIAATSASTIDGWKAQGKPDKARIYTALLAANLGLNSSWTWLFFRRRKLGGAAVAAGALTVSSADLTRRAIHARGATGAALAPYPLWCAFATLLSTRIWWLNR
jgi:translocator protein